jgi:deazaflavin-dependent oxidoreductase (nitroreductase family)
VSDDPTLERVRTALRLTRDSSARERTIDITTTGARTGTARRIEIWLYRAEDRWFLTTTPARRGWYANLLAHPAFTVHLKNGVRADLPATARPVPDPGERARILEAVVDDLNQPANPGGIPQPQQVEDWIAGSPLLEVVFDDPEVTAGG